MAEVAPAIQGPAPRRFSDVLRYSLSILSAGAGAIHIAVIQAHFEEYWASGVFFAVTAWLQILWAVLIVARPSRLVVLSGVAINAIIIGVWVVSRTVGIPLGPDAGSPEAAEFVDIAATAFELLLVLGGIALLFRGATSRAVGRGALVSSTFVLGLTVVVLATAAIISFSPEHGEAEAEHDEQEQTGTGDHG